MIKHAKTLINALQLMDLLIPTEASAKQVSLERVAVA